MCISAKVPDVPVPAERQAVKLPDNGATGGGADNSALRRRALLAGLITSPQGVLGSPVVSKPTLG